MFLQSGIFICNHENEWKGGGGFGEDNRTEQ